MGREVRAGEEGRVGDDEVGVHGVGEAVDGVRAGGGTEEEEVGGGAREEVVVVRVAATRVDTEGVGDGDGAA